MQCNLEKHAYRLKATKEEKHPLAVTLNKDLRQPRIEEL